MANMADILCIPLSPKLARALESAGRTPDQTAKETLADALFHEGRLNHFDLGKLLELDRFETGAVLKRHQIVNNGLTMNDLESDRATLGRVLGPPKN